MIRKNVETCIFSKTATSAYRRLFSDFLFTLYILFTPSVMLMTNDWNRE